MFEWHHLPDETKRNILIEVGNEKGYPANVVERIGGLRLH